MTTGFKIRVPFTLQKSICKLDIKLIFFSHQSIEYKAKWIIIYD